MVVLVFAADDGQEAFLEPARHRTHAPLAYLDPVDAADRSDLALGAGEEQRFLPKVFRFI